MYVTACCIDDFVQLSKYKHPSLRVMRVPNDLRNTYVIKGPAARPFDIGADTSNVHIALLVARGGTLQHDSL